MDTVQSLHYHHHHHHLTSSVQHNCTTCPTTVAVQYPSHPQRIPLDVIGGHAEDFWKSAGDVHHHHQLPQGPAYCNIAQTDLDDDQSDGRTDRLLGVEDSDVLQRLLPSAASDDHPSLSLSLPVTTSPAALRRRTTRVSECSLLGDDDVTRRHDDVHDVTVVDDVPWCKVPDASSMDDSCGAGDLTTRLETVL